MNAAHTNEIASNGIDVVREVEGQEWDVNVLPFDWLDQVDHELGEFERAILRVGEQNNLFLQQ